MERVPQLFTFLRGGGESEIPTGPKVSLVGSLIVLSFAVLFFLWKHFEGGIHPPHLLFGGAIVILYFAHPLTRVLLFLAAPLAVYGVLYDSFQYIPFARLQPIHVADPYYLDAAWFGVRVHGEIIHLHEYLFQHLANPFLDFVSGIFYLLHVPMAVLFLLLFWRFRSEALAGRFAFAFLVMNVFAFLTYCFYPAAAPWYVAKYGFLQPTGPVMGDPAGLARFDHLLGIDLFTQNYQINPIIFGAIPSMHAGVATLIWIYSFQLGKRWAWAMGSYMVVMWFSALYLQHHYAIDLFVGVVYAFLAWFVTDQVFSNPLNRLFNRLALPSDRQEGDPKSVSSH